MTFALFNQSEEYRLARKKLCDQKQKWCHRSKSYIYTPKFSLNCKLNNVHYKKYLHPIANQLTDYQCQYLEIDLLD